MLDRILMLSLRRVPFALLAVCVLTANAQQPVGANLVQGTLIAPGGIPFHLKAEITEGREQSPVGTVEMFWVSPDRWRRVIQSDEFKQTLIVNGDKVSEQDSDDYFPLGLRTLVTAMVDPWPIVAALQPGDTVRTKANGFSFESGMMCFDPALRMCVMGRYGLMEELDAAGHSVEFMDYEKFHGQRIARRLIYQESVGDFMTEVVTELKELGHPDPGLFTVAEPTTVDKQIHVAVLREEELRGLAVHHPEIIWPQALDGAETGEASFYVSIDPQGKVREVLPLRTANERTNDSAIRQIMRWTFQPPAKAGLPAQAEGILSFAINTREWGPKEPLTDAEVRKLAANPVDPVIPPGKYPPGTVYKLRIAVDADGNIIEEIADGGPPELFGPCDAALKQWHLRPVDENGQPRPYRAEVVFRVP